MSSETSQPRHDPHPGSDADDRRPSVAATRRDFLLKLAAMTAFVPPAMHTLSSPVSAQGKGGNPFFTPPGHRRQQVPSVDGGDLVPSSRQAPPGTPPWTRPPPGSRAPSTPPPTPPNEKDGSTAGDGGGS